ncbi:hypothetical protein OAL55_00890 [Verrucomicrobiales bacterium]|nr:hypothetical protein [Verrucomicrobiales bacterium]
MPQVDGISERGELLNYKKDTRREIFASLAGAETVASDNGIRQGFPNHNRLDAIHDRAAECDVLLHEHELRGEPVRDAMCDPFRQDRQSPVNLKAMDSVQFGNRDNAPALQPFAYADSRSR